MKKIILTVLWLGFISGMNAQNPEQKGLEIAQAANKADEGFGSSSVNLRMVLKNKNGQTSEREITTKTLEQIEDGDKSLVAFNSPKDVKGTATLTYTHKIGSDDQWLYLPSIKRVKRISSSNKSGPFMGSEFAFEDLSSDEVEKYTHKFIEEKDGFLIVEQDPVDPKSGYSRRLVSYNQNKDYRVEKIEFYDRKNTLLKTLNYGDYKQYKNKHWRSGKMVMTNHQNGKETTLIFSDYDFGLDLAEEDFTENALKRIGS
ncbi:outer membrane lipoprotein-sorting protein [Flagellimonas meridianipacifica]|uniref:Outer membrane lipoprotein-sorting protein n=1 Tax=Flagellimonas meridianipacifica TaxID=1080225 RepID=A0A2T0MIM3_9FLAO|nr:outer membrane lipoprotein-sorting protein [Allomuricauda pacifica]PRX57409.1 outer membrane lipoprotein-sorting protein [Allomuricauda pacifica]